MSPSRQRLGLYFQLHAKNIGHNEVCQFLRHLLRNIRGRVILIWDNGTIHKGDPIRQMCREFPRLRLERFPAYAPELNPDESVWSHAKKKLANGRPDNQSELRRELLNTLGGLRRSQRLLRACVNGSDLPPFL